MLTENNRTDYIGKTEPVKTEPVKTELYEILFYLSLFVLIVFYISVISKYLLKKSERIL